MCSETSPRNTDITTITGDAEAGSSVVVSNGATVVGTDVADASGEWEITCLTLGEGSYSFTAVATDAAGNPSVASSPAVDVIVDKSGPTVTASPIGGTYATSQSVTLSSESGATIYYTTNEDTPTGSSPVYSSAISITATTTLKAIGKDTLDNFGSVMTEVYTINAGPVTSDTSLSLQLSGNNKIKVVDSLTATGKLINAVADSPISGKTVTFKIDGTTVATTSTDSKGKFSVTLTTSTLTPGKYDVQVSFAGDSQYNPSSMTKKLTVESNTNAPAITSTGIESSLSLKVDGKDKLAGGAGFTVSGKLIDSVSKKPISGKEVSVTTDGDLGTDTTNSKGEFDVDLKAPNSAGNYDVKAQFNGDGQYKSSESSVKITGDK